MDYLASFIFLLYFQGVVKLVAKRIGTVSGRLFVGTTEKIPPSEIGDTTGAGDAFIGAVLYGKKCQVLVLFISSIPKPVDLSPLL